MCGRGRCGLGERDVCYASRHRVSSPLPAKPQKPYGKVLHGTSTPCFMKWPDCMAHVPCSSPEHRCISATAWYGDRTSSRVQPNTTQRILLEQALYQQIEPKRPHVQRGLTEGRLMARLLVCRHPTEVLQYGCNMACQFSPGWDAQYSTQAHRDSIRPMVHGPTGRTLRTDPDLRSTTRLVFVGILSTINVTVMGGHVAVREEIPAPGLFILTYMHE